MNRKHIQHNQVFEENTIGRDFIVSDIHGEYNRFLQKLKEVDFNKDVDRIFSVGDLIDRGPKSLDCLNLVFEPWFFPVIGNHESFLLDVYNGNSHTLNCWLQNGGNWFYSLEQNIREDALKAAKRLINLSSYTITLKTSWGKIGISHAEPPTPDWDDVKDLNYREIEILLWGRTHIKYGGKNPTQNVDLTVHGHTIVREIFLVANALYIDTGSYLRAKNKHFDITLLDVGDLKKYVKN